MDSFDHAATLFLGLSQLHGVGFKTLREMGGVDAAARSAMNGDLDELVTAALGGVPPLSTEATLLELGNAVVERLRSKEAQLVRIGDPLYPTQFLDLPEKDRPLWFFVRGNAALLQMVSVAVVGTRDATLVGEFLTKFSVTILADLGIPVVSGLAKGVDAIAHEWALTCNVPTVSVLGTGILRSYPPKNTGLAERIVEAGGTLISEYLPDSDPSGENFVWRNRLQAALACCVVAPEWKRSSGTAHTMRFARALKRPSLGLRLASLPLAPDRGFASREFAIPRQANEFEAALLNAIESQLNAIDRQKELFGDAP